MDSFLKKLDNKNFFPQNLAQPFLAIKAPNYRQKRNETTEPPTEQWPNIQNTIPFTLDSPTSGNCRDKSENYPKCKDLD